LDGVTQRLGASNVVQSFFSLLIDQRRLVDFLAIREEFERLASEDAGLRRAEVISAGPLRDDQLQRLQRALSARTGGEVEVSVRVDESLLGGVIAKIGDLVFDGSLRTQLRQLRANLTR
jgi:F-type H+-transporting ATPase subunit delta